MKFCGITINKKARTWMVAFTLFRLGIGLFLTPPKTITYIPNRADRVRTDMLFAFSRSFHRKTKIYMYTFYCGRVVIKVLPFRAK